MGRLIDADILIAELKESALHHCNNPREDSLLQRDRVIVRAQSTVEAIPKDQYEARLKADINAILVELQLEIEEKSIIDYDEDLYDGGECVISISEINEIIQQKINSLKEERNERNEVC